MDGARREAAPHATLAARDSYGKLLAILAAPCATLPVPRTLWPTPSMRRWRNGQSGACPPTPSGGF